MKTSTILLLALGFASQSALAQLYPPPDAIPDPHAQPGQVSPPSVSPPSDAPSSTGADTSGASDTSPSGAGGAAGTSSGTMPDTSGSSDTPAATSPDSSGPTGVQSEAGAELRPAAPLAERLQPQTQNDVTYLCGGVGQEEASYMKKEARAYDMMLTFATRDGDYLADVNVDIRDAKGKPVLQASCDSPMLLVDLPRSGTYRIHADAAGYTLDRTARVQVKQRKGARVASVVLVWPQRVAEAPAEAGTASGSSAGNDNSGSGKR